MPDLKRHYGVDLMDTIRGRGTSPALVMMYVRALPEESLSKALLRDQPETEGWGMDRHILAGIFDVIRENTTLTAGFKKDPKLSHWPRPGDEEAEEKKPVTVADLWAQLSTK